jgi:hypothetical protein
MGTFDCVEFPGEKFPAQLKTWTRMMRTYRVGDPVPIINLNPHSIKTEEGYGWINIKDRFIESLTDEPLYEERYNKWGSPLDLDGKVIENSLIETNDYWLNQILTRKEREVQK